MRINCAKCGVMHDSTMTPFKYDKVQDVPINVDGNKEVRSRFDCKHCGRTNLVAITWHASAYGPREPFRRGLWSLL